MCKEIARFCLASTEQLFAFTQVSLNKILPLQQSKVLLTSQEGNERNEIVS